MDKITKIISAFPCTGKTYLTKNVRELLGDDIKILDLDSSDFHFEDGLLDVNSYIAEIKKAIGNYDYILVSTHEAMRKALAKNKIKFTIVVPSNKDLTEIMIRSMNRDDDPLFTDKLIDNFDRWLKAIEEEDTYQQKMVLKAHEYLSDVILDV